MRSSLASWWRLSRVEARRLPHALACWALLLGCRSGGGSAASPGESARSSTSAHPASEPSPPPTVSFAAASRPTVAGASEDAAPGAAIAAADAEATIDFEDEFDYGSADEEASVPQASAKDVAALRAGKTTYYPYTNPRFGFTVDVPSSFDTMPPPTNGDGLQFRLGKLAVMTASGGNWDGPRYDICPNSAHVTARRSTATSCFATGKANGFIFWRRSELRHGVVYDLVLQYVESLKDAMDPVVKHVNASWRIGRPARPDEP